MAAAELGRLPGHEQMDKHAWECDVAVIGGAGRVGLPLALVLAESGLQTAIIDTDGARVQRIAGGRMPFSEEGAQEILASVLECGRLEVYSTPERVADCHFVVLIIGTPVDAHLDPDFDGIVRAIEECIDYLRDGQIMVLRSTVYPGTSRRVQRLLRDHGLRIEVAACPERVAQGQSIREFRTLPQVISAFDADTLAEVRWLFSHFAQEFIELQPMEAEICKLMTNAWRYIQFATTNQFYMIATEFGLDYQRILHACRHNYPRMTGMPGPGFAAGPCLRKDTMQLAALSQNSFVIGHAAMLVNEGLPAFMIAQARKRVDLSGASIGILGMAFKAGSDDMRDSLSYKLRRLLRLDAARVLCTDPYVQDADLCPLDQVLRECSVLFVATPHDQYRSLSIPADTVLIDVWECVASPSGGPT